MSKVTANSKSPTRVAVILCGSGFKDGSEIRESVATLCALSAQGTEVQCFALDEPQADVVNCLTAQAVAGETRNQLVESARIARGQVKPLTDLDPAHFDALIIPGGFGVAKNLCSFASLGAAATVNENLVRQLRGFYSLNKPIGAICIAPVTLALSFKDVSLELTLGADSEAAQEIEKLGHRHVVTAVTECHLDRKHRVVTTPAYMYADAPLHEIFVGIEKLVKAVLQLC